MPAPHDRGGWPTDEPIDQAEHQWADWEHQTQALYSVLSRKRIMAVDELRAGIESLPADEYEASSYFERWSASIERALVGKGILTTVEIDAKAAVVDALWHAS
jgi:nitrile hydratase